MFDQINLFYNYSYNCDKCQTNGLRDVSSDEGFTTNSPDDDVPELGIEYIVILAEYQIYQK